MDRCKMGMYCVCGVRIDSDPVEAYKSCCCSWDGWVSCHDFPEYRGNKKDPCRLPNKEGIYLVRIQSASADRDEFYSKFCKVSRKTRCGYTGIEVEVNWSGDPEQQPYAWYDVRMVGDE